FDLYMLHELKSREEVEAAFAPGGAMDVIMRAKEAGLIRHIGLTAHSEDAAIQALAYFDFESVMFPINWALNMDWGFGDRLISICEYRGLGLIAIKPLAHRAFCGEEEAKKEPKAWVKTIYDNDELAIAAIKYTLSKGVDSLVPPGNFGQFSFVVEHIDECLANPLTDSDRAFLEEELALIEGRHIFDR
ncbi:MAG: aldo/keto reductase, partial [Clostridiales bacterium]|nr:aldo/keto reductase [Clostridiales bacterium]